MPRTAITVNTIDLAGEAPGVVAFDQPNGMEYLNTNGNVHLIIMNVGTGSKTLTVSAPATVGQRATTLQSETFTVPVSTTEPFIVPAFQSQFFNDSSDNLVDVDIDVGTDVTIAAVIIPLP